MKRFSSKLANISVYLLFGYHGNLYDLCQKNKTNGKILFWDLSIPNRVEIDLLLLGQKT